MASAATRELMADAYVAAVTHATVHSASPGSTNINQVASRVAITWPADTTDDGVRVGTAQFTIPANTTITHAATWQGASSTTNQDADALSAPFVGPGEFLLTVRVPVS
jgi:hypothetical protein